jgi:hypothetical protein
VEPYLRPERAKEIADSLRAGGTFTCHETTVPGPEDDDGMQDMVDGPKAAFCAGALVTMEKAEEPNQIMRIAERLGSYDRTRLDMDSPTYDSLNAWVKSYQEDTGLVHCDVVGDECEDPAGYMVGGQVVDDHEPTCSEDDTCWQCGRVMCPSCTQAEHLCVECEPEDDD